jgi:hypothetical protein
MSTVSVVEGIKYGFGLLAYIFAVGLAAGIIMIIGAFMAQAGSDALTFIGFLVTLSGGLTLYAGMLGIGYKVAADAVKEGVDAAK